jgi:hypothetical protein
MYLSSSLLVRNSAAQADASSVSLVPHTRNDFRDAFCKGAVLSRQVTNPTQRTG